MSRKGENIYKRKDGRWEARIIVDHASSCKSVYKSVYGHTYSEVKQKRMRFLEHQCYLKSSEKVSLRFSDWLSGKKCFIKPSTYDKYFNIIKLYLEPYFGGLQTNEITASTVQSFVNSMMENGLSASVIHTAITILKSVLYTTHNSSPNTICAFDRIKMPAVKMKTETLSKEVQSELTAFLLADISNVKLGVLICLYTGIRIGELCALKWSDISGESISISKTLQRLNTQGGDGNIKTVIQVTEPKSLNSARTIPIPQFLRPTIENLRNESGAYVLTGTAKPTEPRAFRKRFNTMLRQCGLPHINFHSLRHTFATRCIECGVDIKTLSEILGHSSVRITLDRYVHISFEQKYENINKLISFFLPSQE